MKNCELLSFASPDELAHAAAGAWLDEIESAHRTGTPHCVALSGGRITEKFFTSTVGQANAHAIPFEHVHFFWADERCVPPDNAESNFKLANELLFAPLKIAGAGIHRIRGEDSPEIAVAQANAEISSVATPIPGGRPALDLIFLGLGEDGHVASLFPGKIQEIAGCKGPFLFVKDSPKPPPRRISLSYAVIAAAKQVWVLVSGAGKETALGRSLDKNGGTPLARVIQSRSCTKIFSDVRPG